MTSRDFCYWLQGYLEIHRHGAPGAPQGFTAGQVDVVGRHLALVFKHEIDPSIDGGSAEVAAELQAIHDGQPGQPAPVPDGDQLKPQHGVLVSVYPKPGGGETVVYRC